jgi:adenosylmethionine-8-amino-7-oxononanoate transaminase
MDIEAIKQKEKRHLWHPFTQMQAWEADEPLFIESGEGVRVRDIEGREYYDANSSLWVNVHGHGKKEIDAAVAAQLDRIAHSTMLGLTHVPAAELAESLVRLAPEGLTRVFYSDSGSEAVEIALKMAYQYWRHRGQENRTRYIALAEGYHGDTIGAVSVGGIPLFHGIFRKLLFTVDFAPSPSQSRDVETATAGLEALLMQHAGSVAAVIVEPLVQAAGGMLLAPPGTLRRMRELCSHYDTLLIVDEVATGFGRTGRMFACEHEGVSPDLMCLAKGLTGGYLPLAATMATERIFQAFLGEYHEFKTFFHGHSYTGNPLACSAALANLEVFERERVIEGLPPKIERVRCGLERFRELSHVGEVRQCGLMVGIELVRDRTTGEPFPREEQMGAKVCRRARRLGLISRPLGDVVIFVPPLASTEADLDAMLAILHRAIVMVTEDGEPG